jgi:NADH-quinone oxidoreductase subunit N
MGVLDLRPAVPAIILAITGVVVLLAQAFTPRGGRAPSAALSLFGLAGALVAVVALVRSGARGAVMGGTLALDDFSLFFHVLILVVGMVAVMLSPSYLRVTGFERGEYYALVIFSVIGMIGLASSLELVSIFVALEVMSISVYALAGLHRDRLESQESAVKYFITGAFSSAFFLYGVALLYGASGTTHLAGVGAAVGAGSGLALLGVGFLLVGFGFKIASVPFHMWAPDVYEGAPTTVTALMSAGVKAAAFAALLRVFWTAAPGLHAEWQPAVAVLAIVTMVIGNLAALTQTNIKRMLAYSSVAHAGYLLTALVAAPQAGAQAILFYLVAYAAVNLGGFGAISALARADREPVGLNDMAGLSVRRPLLAAAIAIYMVSLTGIPVSAGFVGKFYLFNAAVDAGYVNLAIFGMITSVISAYYYLRVVVYMYMRDPVGEDTWQAVETGPAVALALAALLVVGLGILPTPVLDWAHAAATAIASR